MHYGTWHSSSYPPLYKGIFVTVIMNKIGEQALQQLNENFTKVGPLVLMTREEENPVYLARRLMLRDMQYNADLNITAKDEFALTKVSLKSVEDWSLLYMNHMFVFFSVQIFQFMLSIVRGDEIHIGRNKG